MPYHPRALELLRRQPIPAALAAAATGRPCHLVGGALRDRLLGFSSRDFDAVVAGDGERVAAALAERLGARLIRLGKELFAAFRLVGTDFVVDLWDRKEMSLEADLLRRDFTINAFALDLRSGEIADPSGGLRDLRYRLLRAASPSTFTADPLRLLRLPRMVAQLPGFTADPDTVQLAARSAPTLERVAAERIRDELRLIVSSADAPRALALLHRLDLYPGLWWGRAGTPGPAGKAVAELERLGEILGRWQELAAAPGPPVDAAVARWAILFRNLPGRNTAIEALRRFTATGYLVRGESRRVKAVMEWQSLPADDVMAERRFLHRCGELWPTVAAAVGARSAPGPDPWPRTVRALADLASACGGEIFDPPALVDGEQVQRLLGIGPGPAVGRVLDRVRRAQVEGRIGSRQQAEKMVLELRAEVERPPAT